MHRTNLLLHLANGCLLFGLAWRLFGLREADWVRAIACFAAAAFFAVYVAVTGLSLPGAAILTLVGGAVFGLLWGTVIVSFASSIGATLAFLVSRFLLFCVAWPGLMYGLWVRAWRPRRRGAA